MVRLLGAYSAAAALFLWIGVRGVGREGECVQAFSEGGGLKMLSVEGFGVFGGENELKTVLCWEPLWERLYVLDFFFLGFG